MDDDLNTSVALSVIFELVRLAQGLLENSRTTKETFNMIVVLFDRLGGDVLGIVQEEYPQEETDEESLTGKLINVLIEQRNEARQDKDFDKADQIRATLDKLGIILEDKPDMTTWRMK